MDQSPLIAPDALAACLGNKGVRVIDASWYLPNEKRDTRHEYLLSHIRGAVFFDIDANSDVGSPFPHMLVNEGSFRSIARRLGIDDGDKIVVYDSAGLFSAARVWWNFRVMGAKDVFVLDGGLPAWRALDLPLASGEEKIAEGNFSPHFNPALVRSFENMMALVREGGAQILDARGAQRFRGEVPEPRPGVVSGHMPGSINLHYAWLLEPDGRLKSPDRLQEEFQRRGVHIDEPIVTTCGSGVTAAIIALAIAALGRGDVPIYDGSWSEWGARPESAGLIAKSQA